MPAQPLYKMSLNTASCGENMPVQQHLAAFSRKNNKTVFLNEDSFSVISVFGHAVKTARAD